MENIEREHNGETIEQIKEKAGTKAVKKFLFTSSIIMFILAILYFVLNLLGLKGFEDVLNRSVHIGEFTFCGFCIISFFDFIERKRQRT